jgi:hypothetical protein
MRNFVDVKGKLGLHMGVFVLRVSHHRPVHLAKLWELDRHGEIGCGRMAHRIADVMRQRAHGECQLIRIPLVFKEAGHKVPGSHVVGQLGEEDVAEGIVADVLDRTASVGIGTCCLEFRRSRVRVPAPQQRQNRILPGKVDQLFVSQQRIRASGGRSDKRPQHEKTDANDREYSRRMTTRAQFR